MSLAFINLRACSKDAFRFFSVVAVALKKKSFIGLGTIAMDLFADSRNDEIALSAWSTLFTAKSRTCGGTSIASFGSDMSLSLSGSFPRTYHVEGSCHKRLISDIVQGADNSGSSISRRPWRAPSASNFGLKFASRLNFLWIGRLGEFGYLYWGISHGN